MNTKETSNRLYQQAILCMKKKNKQEEEMKKKMTTQINDKQCTFQPACKQTQEYWQKIKNQKINSYKINQSKIDNQNKINKYKNTLSNRLVKWSKEKDWQKMDQFIKFQLQEYFSSKQKVSNAATNSHDNKSLHYNSNKIYNNEHSRTAESKTKPSNQSIEVVSKYNASQFHNNRKDINQCKHKGETSFYLRYNKAKLKRNIEKIKNHYLNGSFKLELLYKDQAYTATIKH